MHHRLLIAMRTPWGLTFTGMRSLGWAPLLAAAVLLATGCRKEEDTEAPVITILTPGAGHVLTVPDTLVVTAEVSDNERIGSVQFSVTDANGFPATGSVTIDPSGNSTTLVVKLPITSEQVLSGPHTVQVVASDGDNRGTATRAITVNGLPRRTRAIYLVGSPGSSPIQIYRIDSTGQLGTSPVTTLSHDIGPSAISSRSARLFVGAGVTGQLTALFPDDGTVSAQISVQNTLPIPYHTAIHTGPTGLVFTASNEGDLRRYGSDLTGTGYATQALSAHRIVGILEMQEAVITTQSRYTSPGGYSLVRYSPVAAVQQNAWLLDKTPIEVFDRNSDHVLLFGNRSGQGVVEDRNIVDGGYWEPRTFPDPILAVARIDPNIYIVSTIGSLQRFNYANASALTIATGLSAEAMAYDEVNGVLIISEGGQVSFLDPLSGATLSTWSVPMAVTEILPLYNR